MNDSMRIGFGERPWDLVVCFAYTAMLTAGLFLLKNGSLAAVLLVIAVPGYLLIAALFPKDGDLGWIERIALSLGLSVVVVAFLGFAMNLIGLDIRFPTVVGAIVVFAGAMGGFAFWRRIQLPADRRLRANIDISWQGWQHYSPAEKFLSLSVVGMVILGMAIFSLALISARTPAGFTVFYVVGGGENKSQYPSLLNVSQPSLVTIGVVNNERNTVAYAIRIDLVGIQLVFNSTSGSEEPVELNRTTWSSFNFTLENEQSWTRSYGFKIDAVGLWMIQFMLFNGSRATSVYREVQVFVRTTL